jgi:hypothetical protein
MITVFAALKTARFWLRATPYIVAVAILIGFVLWIRGMQSTIADQSSQINKLAVNLRTEQVARAKDVAGLTTLSSGLLAASSAKDKDQAALQETIDAAHPTPVSAGLAALLGCLRQADDNKQCAATARTGGPAAGATAGSH